MAGTTVLEGGDLALPESIQDVFSEYMSFSGATTPAVIDENDDARRALLDGRVGIDDIPGFENDGKLIIMLDDDALQSAGILQLMLGKAGVEVDDVYCAEDDSFFTVVCTKERIAFRFIQDKPKTA